MITLLAAPDSILLDVGGSYIKSASTLSGSQVLQNVCRIETPPFLSTQGFNREIAASELDVAVRRALRIQYEKFPKAYRILISGQMGGYVIDGRRGKRIVSWQDNRSLSPDNLNRYLNLVEKLDGSSSFTDSGSALHPGLPLISIGSDKNLENSNTQVFQSLISYVAASLCGVEISDMHITDAAASGFYDLKNSDWSPELIGCAGTKFTFPNVHNTLFQVGTSREFSSTIYCAVGDQQASLLGSGLTSKNIVVNIGTGGQVAGLHSGNFENSNVQLRPYFDGQLIKTITYLPSGRSLKAFVEFCIGDNNNPENFEEFFEMAVTKESIGDLDLSDFDSTIKNISLGIHANNYKGIAGSYLNSLAKAYTNAINRLNLQGDLIFAGRVGQKFKKLAEQISNLTSRNYTISKSYETTLQGLAELTSEI